LSDTAANSNDTELAHRCQRGDREAQRTLYDSTAVQVYRVLLRMTGGSDEAFDLTQESYLRVFRGIHAFDGRSRLSTWVYRIAVNEGLQFLRRRRAASRPFPKGTFVRPEPAHPHVRLDVQQALGNVDPCDRAILVLRYQEGLDYREIAGILQCAEGTVGSRLNRARNRLRELLGDAYGSGEESRYEEHPNLSRTEPQAQPG
jgi:RNA polymerase sigma-70 factor (ECF subfamily)